MANNVYTCADAIKKLTTVYGKSDIVEIVLSSEAKTQDRDYAALANLLDTTNIVEGYYLIEPDGGDAKLGQKVHVTFKYENLDNPEIILTVDIKAGETLDLAEIWSFNDNSAPDRPKGVMWDSSTNNVEDSFSHTYDTDYTGTVKIYNYSIRSSAYGNYTAPETGNKFRITDIEFKKPQVVENAVCLFNNFCKEYDNGECIGLRTIKGTIYFSETYENGGLGLFLYNVKTLTSLKGFTIVCSSSKPQFLTSIFQNSNLDDVLLSQIKFVNLNLDKITSYKATFAGTKITKVNNKLVGTKTMEFQGAFEGAAVTYIPEGILDNCKGGHRTFLNSQVSSIHPNVTLKNLVKGNGMFAGCPLSYNYSKQLYDTLTPVPEGETVTKPSNMNDNYNYVITFAYVDGEEEYIAEAFEIPENNPDTTQPWSGDKGIPLSIHGQFWKAPNGWYISFSDN